MIVSVRHERLLETAFPEVAVLLPWVSVLSPRCEAILRRCFLLSNGFSFLFSSVRHIFTMVIPRRRPAPATLIQPTTRSCDVFHSAWFKCRQTYIGISTPTRPHLLNVCTSPSNPHLFWVFDNSIWTTTTIVYNRTSNTNYYNLIQNTIHLWSKI